jgi:hypothetical protein
MVENESRQVKRVLMIAYHFPPLAGSSGIQRTLRFVQHLPKFGWEPIVLSANSHAYERTSDDLMDEIPQGTIVNRSFALDTARHLSLGGRYMASMARPDRWISWKFAGVYDGLRLIGKYKPDVIWSTYPIATAHLIGAELHRRTGLPWVTDFRDPMAQDNYPADLVIRRQFREIEAHAVRHAALSFFTTPGAARICRERYPDMAECIQVLENGYDEESFKNAEKLLVGREPLIPGAVTLLHSGIVYPSERDPTALFVALQYLKERGDIQAGRFKIRFRAAVHDAMLSALAKSHGVEGFIETCPPITYREALAEMLRADALLLMQASNCNEQIPAKIYEYLRAHRPILGLTDPSGDTAGVLRSAGVGKIAALDSSEAIRELIVALLQKETEQLKPDDEVVTASSRRGRTQLLAQHLNGISDRITGGGNGFQKARSP